MFTSKGRGWRGRGRLSGSRCVLSGVRNQAQGGPGWMDGGRKAGPLQATVCVWCKRGAQTSCLHNSVLSSVMVHDITTITQYIRANLSYFSWEKIIVDALKGQFTPKSGIFVSFVVSCWLWTYLSAFSPR